MQIVGGGVLASDTKRKQPKKRKKERKSCDVHYARRDMLYLHNRSLVHKEREKIDTISESRNAQGMTGSYSVPF